MTHICVSDLTSIGSDNGLSPGRRQAIIRTNAGLMLIEPLGTNFNESLIEILIFSLKKMRLKVSSAKRRPFCLGLNVLTLCSLVTPHDDTDLDQHWLRLWLTSFLTWTDVDFTSVRSRGIHPRAIFQEMIKIAILDIGMKITNLRFNPGLPGVNELT